MTYATALNRNELFESPGLRRDIPSLLDPEEEVLLVLPGVAGDFPDVMIASATRFLLASVAGPLKRSARSVHGRHCAGLAATSRALGRPATVMTSLAWVDPIGVQKPVTW